MTDCAVMGNQATGGADGWAVQPWTAAGSVGGAYGGALYCAGVTNRMTGCRLEANTAAWPGPTFGGRPAEAGGGAIYQASGRSEVIECLFVTNSVAGGSSRFLGEFGPVFGGALCARGQAFVEVSRCEFKDNTATGGVCARARAADSFGGAVFNESVMVIKESWLAGNRVTGGRNGQPLFGAVGRGLGGAIWTSNSLAMVGCTLNANRAVSLSGVQDNSSPETAFGGAVGNAGAFAATNNTFYANTAEGGPGNVGLSKGGDAQGGAIYSGAGSVTLVHQTFAENAALGGVGSPPGSSLGGAVFVSGTNTTLKAVILAHSVSGANVEGQIVDGGNNLSSDNTPLFTSASSRKNIDTMLGPLADNGGPTPTMALLEGSPAIDAVAVGSSYPATDQRGEARPSGAGSDIGAFEVDNSPAPLHLTISLPESDSILLHVEGIQSTRHILERSGNLTTWEPIWTNATLPFDFFDTMIGPPGARWYRARTEP